LSIAKINWFLYYESRKQLANMQMINFSFYNVKDHGCVFWGENFDQKRKSWTQLGSHIVIKPLDVELVFLFFTWVNPHYKGNSRKSFPWRSLYNLCLPMNGPFLWKIKDMDCSRASWFLLGFGVEVGLAPNTPPTPGSKTFCDPLGCVKGIMPCILGERSIFIFLCWGVVPHVPKYWWWPKSNVSL
jgi:hypothetical protein